MIAGASMGMFTGYCVSANKLDELEYIYRSVDIPKKAELFWQVFAHGLLASTTENVIKPGDRLDIPFCFPLCMLSFSPVRYYLLHGEYNPVWRKYIHAGVNYPFLKILPSMVEGRITIDGGAMDNIPLYPILRQSRGILTETQTPDIVFALHFDSRYDYRKDFKTDIPILDTDISVCNDFKKEHYNFSSAYIDEMITTGEAYGEKICEFLFEGDLSRDGLQKKVDEIFLQEHAARQQHISIDRMFSMLNVIGKAMRRDSQHITKLF